MNIGLILFIALLVLLAAGIPIAVAIGGATIVAFLFSDMPLTALFQRMYAGVDSFTLMAVPFFMLAGALMELGGMSTRLVRLGGSLVGFICGGLAHVQVLASCFFAALSGSAVATTAAIGGALIPEMEKDGYPRDFSAAVQAVAGTIGTIIPPSVPMVIYCVSGNVSIGELFAAGFVPGLIYALGIMILIYFVAKKHGYRSTTYARFSGREAWLAFKDAVWALLVPIIILGGIYSGIFTPTEAGAVAAVYGIFAGTVIYRELTFRKMADIFIKSAMNTAMVLLIISSASAFSWLLSIKGVAAVVGREFAAIASTDTIFMLLTIVLLLLMGCFMETVACVLMVTPILLPVAAQLNIDPVHFGIVMVMTLSLGMATPPVGENLYVAASIAGIPFEKLLRRIWPMIAVAIATIVMVAMIPGISLALPRLFLR